MNTDNWDVYLCQMRGSPASIVFNSSLADRLGDSAFNHALRLRIHMKSPDERGLRQIIEYDALKDLEDRLEQSMGELGALALGHITNRGFLYVNFLVGAEARPYRDRVALIALEEGYRIDSTHEPDPDHTAYWRELYPTEDDWSLIRDMKVIEKLRGQGDACAAPRDVTHWAYFPNKTARADYAQSVSGIGFVIEEESLLPEAEHPYCVRFRRSDTPDLGDFTDTNIALNRKAAEFGGVYDGWESMVVKE